MFSSQFFPFNKEINKTLHNLFSCYWTFVSEIHKLNYLPDILEDIPLIRLYAECLSIKIVFILVTF